MFKRGSHLIVFWLYFSEGCYGHISLFKMYMQISMYLFQMLLHIGLTRLSHSRTISIKGLLGVDQIKWLWIKLTPSSIGVSFLTTLFGIALAYNHFVTYRLFVALISINPAFLLIGLCFKKVLGINSFHYEYS
jgi:hypothetical protein